MPGLIAFCLLFVVLAFAASGTAQLVNLLISPSQMLERWQSVLMKIEPRRGERYFFLREFWYKRLGGCRLCMRQFVAETYFIVLCVISNSYDIYPGAYIDMWLLRWMVNILLFTGYSGSVLQIAQMLEPRQESRSEEEHIIETRYRNN